MTLIDIYCPPIPESWTKATPSAVVEEWSKPDPVNPRYLPPPKNEKARASREYQRVYGILHREKLTAQKRAWYAKKGNAKRQQKREKERLAARTAVATPAQQIIPEAV